MKRFLDRRRLTTCSPVRPPRRRLLIEALESREVPAVATYIGTNTTNADRWNQAASWNTGAVPSGADEVIVPSGKIATSWSTSTPAYTGNLSIGTGATVQIGWTTTTGFGTSYNALGTPGSTVISMNQGSTINIRLGGSPSIPAIHLLGDAKITLGSSTQTPAAPTFGQGITGSHTLTLESNYSATSTLSTSNSFAGFVFNALPGRGGNGGTLRASAAGSLGAGDVTFNPNLADNKSFQLWVSANNVMADTATLYLNGLGPAGDGLNRLRMDFNDTIANLSLNGVQQPLGTYGRIGLAGVDYPVNWITGNGILTVAGDPAVHWDINGAAAGAGGPAATGVWDGTAKWNTDPTGGAGGVIGAWTGANTGVFSAGSDAAGTYSVTVVGSKPIVGLIFEEGNVTLSQGPSGALQMTADSAISVAPGLTATIETPISDNGTPWQLSKVGNGTLLLGGANTFTGATRIEGGILPIASLPNAGSPSSLGAFPTAGAAGLVLAGGTLQYTGGTTTTNRGFTLAGDSTIDVSTPGAALTLGASESSGLNSTLTVTGGAGSSLALGALTLIEGANFSLNPTNVSITVASARGYTSYPTGAPTLGLGGATAGNVVTGDLTRQNPPGSAFDSIGLNVAKNGAGEWTINGAINTLSGAMTINAGTLTLLGTGSYTGQTAVNGGTLIAGTNAPNNANGAFGRATSEVTLGTAGGNIDASILIGGSYTIGRAIRLLTNNTTDNGSRVLTLGGITADNSVFAGNIFLGSNNQAGRGVTLTAAAGGQVTFSGIIQNPTSMDATTYAVAKAGPGTVVLQGDNTYTGATSVAAGTLLINGNQSSATGAVTVDGGTLGGTGTIGGAVTVNSGGTLSPGSGGFGTLTVNSTLALGGTSSFDVTGSGALTDRVVGVSTLTYGGTLKIVNLGGALAVGNSWDLFNFTSQSGVFANDAVFGTAGDGTNLPNLGSSGYWSFDYDTGVLSIISANAPPTADAGGPYNVSEGGSVVVTGAASIDPDGSIVLYEWDFDNNGVYDFSSTTPTATFDASLLDGQSPAISQTIQLRVTDNFGDQGTATTTVTVLNVDPAVTLNALSATGEGNPTTATGSFTDPGIGDAHTVVVNWGDPNDATNSTFALPATNTLTVNQSVNSSTDAAVLTVTSISGGQVGFSISSHTYADDGGSPGNSTTSDISTVIVTVTDDDAGPGSDSKTITINNAAPTANFPLGDNETLPLNQGSFSRSGLAFSDVGTLDRFTVTVNYGDGSPTQTLLSDSAAITFNLAHNYITPTTYTVTVVISDDDLGSLTDTFTVTVQSPTVVYIDDKWGTAGTDPSPDPKNPGESIADADPVAAGSQSAVFGFNAFALPNAAIAAVAPGGNVYHNAGVYDQAAVITKPLTYHFQEGPISVGSVGDTAAATINLGVALTVGGNNGNSSLSSPISGAGSLTKQGTGTMTLAGPAANTFTGGTTVANGTLALAKSPGVDALAGPVVIGDNIGGSATVKTAILRVDTDEQLPDGASISFSGNDGRLLISAGAAETIATPTFAAGDVKIAGTLTTTGVYAQTGGSTTLAGGVLRVGTGGTLNSSITGILQGSGTIYTNILTSYGTIDPSSGLTDADVGNQSPGRIAIRGNLQLTPSSITNLDVAAAGSDQINVGINIALPLPAGSYLDLPNYDLDPYLRGDVNSVTEQGRRGVNDVYNINGAVRFDGTLNTRPIVGSTPAENVTYGNSMNFVWRTMNTPMGGSWGDLNPRGANLSSVPSDFLTKNSLDENGLPTTTPRFEQRYMGSGGQYNAIGQSVATMTKISGVSSAVVVPPAYSLGQAKSLTLSLPTSPSVSDNVVKVTRQLWNAKKDSHTRVTLTITNTSAAAVAGPIYAELVGIPNGAAVFNSAGKWPSSDKPYLVVPATSLAGGASVILEVDLLTPLTLGKFSSLNVKIWRGSMS